MEKTVQIKKYYVLNMQMHKYMRMNGHLVNFLMLL